MKKVFLLAIAAASALACGCEEKRPTERVEVYREHIDNVVRVLMHLPGYYTFVVQVPGSKEMRLETRGDAYGYTTEKIFADVLEDERMWVDVVHSSGGDDRVVLEIHIHSEKNIEGSGWRRQTGKNGYKKGETQVIR